MGKCDRCDNPAAVHLLEIENGQTTEKHLCEQHAVAEGLAVQVTSVPEAPISELLNKFVMKAGSDADAAAALLCDQCGLTYEQFRKTGLLGCSGCYEAFGSALGTLLERAHGGEAQHVGKAPKKAGSNVVRQQRLTQLRRDLDDAVSNEQFERAAQLRDEVQQMEGDRE